jgi:penicillin-binding protein 1A
MQLVRQPGLFLTPEKTYERKIKEALLAFELEKTFTKEEIFTYYCNQVYFGHGNYGVEAASEFLFSKSIKDLTLPEAALLAGLPQSPARLSPVEHPERAMQRRNHVLQRMFEEKYISAEEAKAAQGEPLHLSLKRDPPSIAPYFLEEVRKYLEKEYGSQRIYQGGLRVYTTLDSATQIAANRSVRDWLRVMDRRSRGFVPPTESVLKDGKFPDRLHLEDWEGPILAGDVVRGVVLASERGIAVVRIGEYEARIGPAEIAWTRRSNVAEVLKPGTVAPFRIEALPEAGSRDLRVTLEQEPEVQGALLALEPKTGAVRAMVAGTTSSAASSTAPRRPGARSAPPSSPSSTPPPSRRRATRRPPSSWTRPSPSPTTTRSGRRTTSTTSSRDRSPCGTPSRTAGTCPP